MPRQGSQAVDPPFHQSSLEGKNQLLRSAQLKGSGAHSSLLPSCLSPALPGSSPGPSMACLQEPWPHLGQAFYPAAIQGWRV